MEKIEGKFNEAQMRFFNASSGAYSRVTQREGRGDRSVAIDKREREVLFQCIREADVPRQSKEASQHEGFPCRVFRVGDFGKPKNLRALSDALSKNQDADGAFRAIEVDVGYIRGTDKLRDDWDQ